MKNFSNKKVKYFCDYATTIINEFNKVRYGITSCCSKENTELIKMRYELAEWQTSLDYSTLSEVKKKYVKFFVPDDKNDPYCSVNINIINGAAASFKIHPAESTWKLEHSLPFTPNVTTTDLSGQEIQGTVKYINETTINVVFSSPVSGWAYLS